MFRVDDQTAVATLPAAPAPTGSTPGFFTDGNPASGAAPTIVADWWLNQTQEELLAFLTAANIAPVKGTNNQVLAAAVALFGGGGNLASPGWQLLPNGLMIQWGSGVSATGNQDNIFFATAFKSAIWSIVPSEANATGWTASPTPTIYGTTRLGTNLAGFQISTCTIARTGVPIYAAGSAFNYIAIGK